MEPSTRHANDKPLEIGLEQFTLPRKADSARSHLITTTQKLINLSTKLSALKVFENFLKGIIKKHRYVKILNLEGKDLYVSKEVLRNHFTGPFTKREMPRHINFSELKLKTQPLVPEPSHESELQSSKRGTLPPISELYIDSEPEHISESPYGDWQPKPISKLTDIERSQFEAEKSKLKEFEEFLLVASKIVPLPKSDPLKYLKSLGNEGANKQEVVKSKKLDSMDQIAWQQQIDIQGEDYQALKFLFKEGYITKAFLEGIDKGDFEIDLSQLLLTIIEAAKVLCNRTIMDKPKKVASVVRDDGRSSLECQIKTGQITIGDLTLLARGSHL
jgi:hypothetical protein